MMDKKMIAGELVALARDLTAVVDPAVQKMIEAALPDLERQLKPILGFAPRLVENGGSSRHIQYEDDIGNTAMGVFSAVFKRASVQASVSTQPLEDGSYHVGIDMRWEHKNGGSNGGDVATAWFYPDKGTWTIQEGR